MAKTLVNAPNAARVGDTIEVRTLIAHPMETGWRPDSGGQLLTRNIVRRITCHFDDGQQRQLVFAAQLHPAVAANPYLAFDMQVTRSGTLELRWEGDFGLLQTHTHALRVTA